MALPSFLFFSTRIEVKTPRYSDRREEYAGIGVGKTHRNAQDQFDGGRELTISGLLYSLKN
jgi:hypothetical protein